MGSGVAGAIKSHGGQKIEEEAIRLGPIEIGEAVVTSGGNLKANYVIHGAAMGPDLVTDAEKIRSATIHSLMRAYEIGVKSVAIPAFGTGVGGFPVDECADIMLGEAIDYLTENGRPKEVRFVLYGDEAYRVFADKLQKLNAAD
ncbi:MAG: Appr-1-p processing protein [candidate division Zixibacteria bacterium]|nr:Appr-1-p processing protein [candidate division Zixibacteria bacterium]